MSVGNRVYVELLEVTEVPHSILKGASKLRPHGSSEPPVARTGQHPWPCPEMTIPPTRLGCYLMKLMEPCHQTWRSSLAVELLV